MNLTPLDDAFKIHHTEKSVYSGAIKYDTKCIFCGNMESISLMNGDGGSFRQCKKCRKNFRANVVTEPIKNISYSTSHLKGTH
jgi:hypothetical protein